LNDLKNQLNSTIIKIAKDNPVNAKFLDERIEEFWCLGIDLNSVIKIKMLLNGHQNSKFGQICHFYPEFDLD